MKSGAVQVNVIVVAVRTVSTSVRSVGSSGYVSI